MKIRTTLCLAILSAFACALSAQSSARAAASPAAVPRIVAPIDESHLVTLRGNIFPLAHSAMDRGPAPISSPTGRILLLLQRSPAQQQALTQYLSGLQNPSSPTYHKWLTPAQYGAQFGIDPSDIQTVESWLQSRGFHIDAVPPSRNVIEFSGSIDQVQNAFHTSIHSFAIRGRTRFANVTNPQVPAALAPVVAAVGPLNNIRPRPSLQMGPTGHWDPTTHSIQPNLTLFGNNNTPYFFVDPSDAATIYDTPNAALNPGFAGTTYTGSGVTIGIVGESDLPASSTMQDILNYRTAFLGVTAATANLPTVIVDGNDPGLVPGGAAVEALLDNEVAGGLAPGAKIDYYTSAGSDLTDGLFNAIARAIDDNAVDILNVSFGECEATLGNSGNQLVDELAQQAAAQGITVTVSAGDAGSAACDNFNTATSAQGGLAVNGFASTPYTVAVGGTDFDVLGTSFGTYVASNTGGAIPYYLTAKGYIPEEPWNDSTTINGSLSQNSAYKDSNGNTNIIAGGGGVSSLYAKPAFQQSVTPADGHRDLPDVSFFAANGFYGAMWVLCADPVSEQNSNASSNAPDCQNTGGQFSPSTTFSGVGGTSAAAPAFAGMLALVEQKVGGRLGQVDPVLYQLDQSHPSVFHDAVNGNNSVPCASGSPNCGANGFLTGYNASAGYDLASGLGSVDVAALSSDWSSAHFASTSTTLQLNGSTASYSGVHGANVTFNVGVTPTSSTGPVDILDDANTTSGGTASGPQNDSQITIPLASGSGSATYNGLPGGSYTVWANYGGDTSSASSQSTPIHVDISPEESTTVLTVNAYNPQTGNAVAGSTVPYGSILFADARIEGTAEGSKSQGTATGKVTFSNGGTTLGTATIDSGNVASWPPLAATPSIPVAGTYNYTASYSGDSSYNSSTSSTVPVTIAKTATTLTPENNLPILYSSSFSSSIPVAVTLTAPYSLGAAPTGTVALAINGKSAGSITDLTAIPSNSSFQMHGLGNVTGNLPTSGTNTLTETYSGDTNYASSTATTTIEDTDGVGSFTMSNSGNVTILPGDPADVGIHVYPVGGFYGEVYIASSSLPAGVQFTYPLQNLPLLGIENSFDVSMQTAFTTTPGTYPVTITGTDVTGKTKESTTFDIVVNPVPSNANISLSNSGPVSLVAGNTTNNSTNITITPINGFVGPLNFTCKITTSMSNAVSTPGCKGFPDGLLGSSPWTIPITLPTTATTSPGTYTVDISAVDPLNTAIAASTSFSLTVTAPLVPAIALSNSGNITVTAGAATGNTSTITVTPSDGFTGFVNLTCKVTTSISNPNDLPTCSVPQNVVIPGITPVTGTLTVLTTAPTTSQLHFPLTRLFLGGGGATLAMILFFGVPARRRTWRTLLGILVVFVVAGAIGCGGGSSSTTSTGGTGGTGGGSGGGGTTIPGTTPGAYTVTVTGTDAATGQITASTTVNLTVN